MIEKKKNSKDYFFPRKPFLHKTQISFQAKMEVDTIWKFKVIHNLILTKLGYQNKVNEKQAIINHAGIT